MWRHKLIYVCISCCVTLPAQVTRLSENGFTWSGHQMRTLPPVTDTTAPFSVIIEHNVFQFNGGNAERLTRTMEIIV